MAEQEILPSNCFDSIDAAIQFFNDTDNTQYNDGLEDAKTCIFRMQCEVDAIQVSLFHLTAECIRLRYENTSSKTP